VFLVGKLCRETGLADRGGEQCERNQPAAVE
jgi:hypothetical protein